MTDRDKPSMHNVSPIVPLCAPHSSMPMMGPSDPLPQSLFLYTTLVQKVSRAVESLVQSLSAAFRRAG